MIRLCNGRKSVRLPSGGTLRILEDVSLEVTGGEVVAIVGRSGVGKSTMLYLLGLLDRLDDGIYEVEGRSTSRLSDREASALRGQVFGFVFQQYELLEHRTALQNVLAPLQHCGWGDLRNGRQRAEELLNEVGLGDRLMSVPSYLSGGEQQRVAIARALIRSPRYILADEPTGSLDPKTAEEVLQSLIALARGHSCGLLIVSHDTIVASRADRTLRLVDGRLQVA